ncbi:unnamed protein product, partial [Amoebophrya sp. A120]
ENIKAAERFVDERWERAVTLADDLEIPPPSAELLPHHFKPFGSAIKISEYLGHGHDGNPASQGLGMLLRSEADKKNQQAWLVFFIKPGNALINRCTRMPASAYSSNNSSSARNGPSGDSHGGSSSSSSSSSSAPARADLLQPDQGVKAASDECYKLVPGEWKSLGRWAE